MLKEEQKLHYEYEDDDPDYNFGLDPVNWKAYDRECLVYLFESWGGKYSVCS